MSIGRLCAAALLLAAAFGHNTESWPQGYPARPVRYLVADAAGSGSDTIARIVTGNQPPEFKSHVKSEVDRLGALVRKLGLNAN